MSMLFAFFCIAFAHGAHAAEASAEEEPQIISAPIIDDESLPYDSESPVTIKATCKQTEWCDVSDVIFSWDIAEEMREKLISFQWALDSQLPNTKPFTDAGDVRSVALKNIENGVSFFYVMALYSDGTSSPIQVYQIKIDTEPPKAFDISVPKTIIELGQKLQISFHTTDAESGIDHYEVRVDKGDWIRQTTPVVMEGTEVGLYEIEVRALDRAGHETASETVIEVVKKLPIAGVSAPETGSFSGGAASVQKAFLPAIIVVGGMVILTIIFVLKRRRDRLSLLESGV